jgi:carbon-monoxide dehydrogenase small subunit
MKIELSVNGSPVTLEVDPMRRLLDVIREDLAHTGTKEGCGEGECGACSVLLDGNLVNSCLIPVVQAEGCEVTTIEGMRESELGRIISDAFAEAHAVQCGFCSPGMMMAAMGYLGGGTDAGAASRGTGRESAATAGTTGPGSRGSDSSGTAGPDKDAGKGYPPSLAEEEIREAISGNICRCTGYDMIVDGIQLAGNRLAEAGSDDGRSPGEEAGNTGAGGGAAP